MCLLFFRLKSIFQDLEYILKIIYIHIFFPHQTFPKTEFRLSIFNIFLCNEKILLKRLKYWIFNIMTSMAMIIIIVIIIIKEEISLIIVFFKFQIFLPKNVFSTNLSKKLECNEKWIKTWYRANIPVVKRNDTLKLN